MHGIDEEAVRSAPAPEEVLARFKRRLDDPKRPWKISESDYQERRYWDDYQSAFEDALSRCSTPHAPWFIIPANQKWFRNYAISQIVADEMGKLKMKFPPPTVDLDRIAKEYHQAAQRQNRKSKVSRKK